MTWRTGRSVGRTLYRQAGPEPSDRDKMVGVMDTEELAQQVVENVNAQLNPERCQATVIVRDDRWGAIRDKCELPPWHPGPHVAARGACEPEAWLSWWGTAPEPEGPPT